MPQESRTQQRTPDPELLWRFATNLRRLRNGRGHTQVELARISGLGNAYISKCERELINITLANLGALARALKCSEQDFFLTIAPVSKERSP